MSNTWWPYFQIFFLLLHKFPICQNGMAGSEIIGRYDDHGFVLSYASDVQPCKKNRYRISSSVVVLFMSC